MASTEAWLEFEQVRHNIKNNTVDRLKQILSGMNEECGTHFSKGGKKQDIIDRIVSVLDAWRASNFEDKWMKAKAIVYQVRTTGIYTPSRSLPLSGVLPTPPSSHATYDPPKASHYLSTLSGGSSISHYDPYAPPRRPAAVSAPGPSTSGGQKVAGIRFRDSPFFTIDQAVTSVVECPESTSATDRRQQTLSFTLNNDQMMKMKATGSKYQLRLFCTSSIFYAGVNSFRSNAVPCPIEFPPTCEVRVNNTQITASLKGLKKKPGTAPPPDIGKYSRITGSNRVEMVYVNSQQPVQSKKYYMIIMLVETTTIDALVANLKSQHHQSAQDIRHKMIQAMTEDDDIVAGPQKMSLKCPLTFVRITTPCRSSKCVHPQCFDATSWFTMMEQTTTWLCPVCERTLDHKDLILDGYFDEILQQTPESVEDVIVEADGQWHTSDNKYGSAEWRAAHPPAVKPSPSKKPQAPSQSTSCPPPNGNGSAQANGKGKASNIEVLVLDDSDSDDDEGRVKRELSPSYASSANHSFEGSLPRSTQTRSQANNVIDLTLDDSDDDDEPIVSNSHGKRKATDAELDNSVADHDQIWKKGRMDPSRILPVPRVSSGAINGAAPVLHASSINNHPPSSPRYSSSFSNNTLPPPPATYSNFVARNGSSNPSLQLPPLTNSAYLSRPSQNSRWPA
ncbi:PINIT domain-containing protein [Flammula alnicola]|nr:PINIT domain-containing protein [Flammula alnicola]